jgi:dihydroorotate dehydrogenase
LILLKIAPDLNENEIKSIAEIVCQSTTRIDGLIISNTTIARMDTLKDEHRNETGGLSGRPLKEKALATLRLFRYYTKG